MLLETKFDIDQESDLLEWRFVRRDQHAEPDKGKEAGIINFTVGEDFHIQVRGGNRHAFGGFEIVDCCLITRPYIYRCGPDVETEYAPPSPFAGVPGATISIAPDEFEPPVVEQRKKYYTVARNWAGHRTVGEFKGRWDMSFVVTVRITDQDGKDTVRVFSFDPEAEVGSGVLMDEEPRPLTVSMLPEADPGTGIL